MYTIVDRQVQGQRICAAIGIRRIVIILAADIIGLAITTSPGVALTLGYVHRGMYTIVDRQVQGQRICAAIGIRRIVIILAADIIGLAITTSPGVALTLGYVHRGMYTIVDRQVQGQRICAAIGIRR